MKSNTVVEVCCGSIEDAIIAEKAGAHRIELNSSMFFGGLTPSIGTIIETKKAVKIPVMVMIRPRSGGFYYSNYELKAMEEDVKAALKHGADGIVFGALNEDGTINEEACKRILDIVGDKEGVFHRAFDVTPDPFKALDTLINLGIKRILTKGQKNTTEEGAELLKQLVKYSKGKISLMPGGCRPYNIKWIIEDLGFEEVHLASFISKVDPSTLARPDVYFGSPLRPSEADYDIANFEYLKKMCDTIEKCNIPRNK